ncbi:MAG TPA: flagellar motor protein MotB [Sphingomonas sp.]|nr:flagellar motor protein MotB [Sphingomonas sp.]
MRLGPAPHARPLWLITLADLSLLLVGFFVFLQATAHKPQAQQAAIEAGIRHAFGGEATPRIAVDANEIDGFAPGSAALPGSFQLASTWAPEALADPRTRLVVTGYADGSTTDRLDGSALALAGLRADAVSAALAKVVPAERLRLGAAVAPGARRVTLTISYDP